MRARALLWLSLGLNILLAGMIVLLSRETGEPASAPLLASVPTNSAKLMKTNVVLRRQAFSWSEVESPDYAAYIRNLRRIGCPEKTIRDIIVADVNDLFTERLGKEIVFPEQKWWLAEPDMEAFESAMNQVRALELEKGQMLAQLLGPGWLPPRANTLASATRFDGPVLGRIAPDAQNRIAEIEEAAEQKQLELLERARALEGAPEPAELSRLRAETRRQLAGVLSPEQLEEYLLRYSETAQKMRDELKGYGADADEFRRIFRVRDGYEQQLAAVAGTDAASEAKRAEILRMRDEAVAQAVGGERQELYQMTQNSLFREAQQQAEQTGAPPEKVLPIFQARQAHDEEIARLKADQSLSEDQKRIAEATVNQQYLNSITRILANAPAEAEAPAAPAQAAPEIPLPPFPGLPPIPVEPLRPQGPVPRKARP